MNLRPHRPPPPDINLTPLLDVVFLLLIFFMVSTTFKDEARLRVQLPQAQGEDVPAKEPERILVQIDRAGAFYVDERAVVNQDPRTLALALNGALGGRKPIPVLIQADAQAPHQAVMTAMDAAAELGLTHIAFSATRAGTERSDTKDAGTGGGPSAPGSSRGRAAAGTGSGPSIPLPAPRGAPVDADAEGAGEADGVRISPPPNAILAPEARP